MKYNFYFLYRVCIYIHLFFLCKHPDREQLGTCPPYKYLWLLQKLNHHKCYKHEEKVLVVRTLTMFVRVEGLTSNRCQEAWLYGNYNGIHHIHHYSLIISVNLCMLYKCSCLQEWLNVRTLYWRRKWILIIGVLYRHGNYSGDEHLIHDYVLTPTTLPEM